MTVFTSLVRGFHELFSAQPFRFDTVVSAATLERNRANELWRQGYNNFAVVVDVRPELDACAAAVSTPERRIVTRYNATEKCAELFAPDESVLAKVVAHHGDFALTRVFIKTEDVILRNLLVDSIAKTHPGIEMRPDELPIPGKWY